MKSASHTIRFLTGLGILSLALGCTPSVRLTALNPRTTLTQTQLAACQLRYVQAESYLGPACESVGRIELRDTGFTTECSEESNRKRIHKIACEVEANTVVLTRLSNPMLTCSESDAALFQCRGNLGRIEEELDSSD